MVGRFAAVFRGVKLVLKKSDALVQKIEKKQERTKTSEWLTSQICRCNKVKGTKICTQSEFYEVEQLYQGRFQGKYINRRRQPDVLRKKKKRSSAGKNYGGKSQTTFDSSQVQHIKQYLLPLLGSWRSCLSDVYRLWEVENVMKESPSPLTRQRVNMVGAKLAAGSGFTTEMQGSKPWRGFVD